MLVRRAVERVQEDRGGFHERRKNTAVPAHRVGGLSFDAHAQGTEPGPGAVIRAGTPSLDLGEKFEAFVRAYEIWYCPIFRPSVRISK